MKVFAIVIAFAASAALANPPAATTTTTTATETTKTAPADHKAHGKTMKMEKKMETTTTAAHGCSKEDEKAGKCKPEATK